MSLFRSDNPAINKLAKYERTGDTAASYAGIALKSLYFVALTFVLGAASFLFAPQLAGTSWFSVLLIAAPLAAFVCAMIASFKPATTPVTGTLYAVLQGVSIGFISAVFDAAYQGVVFMALISTVSVFGVMMVLYATGVIRVGRFFRRFMMSALLGVLAAHLLMFIMSLFNASLSVLFYGNGTLSIVISVVMIILASLMILFDLDRMTQIVNGRLDKRWEWVAAFGLLITLVWLYVEFLKLFAKLSSRRN